ncbi:ATP-binding cassette domain-containing protein [Shouchella sp. 1P09AA]|uniref:methionine ABC transporter ATP-binding protein n=1 Tax=unclassified Shouchella TaxID=2893065 RepID=UPI0039A0E755
MIEFKGVSKTFSSNGQDIHALREIDLQIEKGDIYGVIGFSGAGKSTLIRTVNLIERPTAGEVIVNKENLMHLNSRQLQRAKRNIGMIFQHFNLLQSKTVFENVATPLRLVKTKKSAVNQRVNELLSYVGLEAFASRYPDQLSGGQKQRVGIARALASNPEILLCDEATSALDPETTSSILQLLKQINKEYNITILMITHELGVVREICNKVAVMDDGRIVEEGNVEKVLSQPVHETTKKFVRSIIPDDLPQKVKQHLENKESDERIYHVQITDDADQTALFNDLVHQGLNVSLLHASMHEIRETTFGSIYVRVKGDAVAQQAAQRYFDKTSSEIKEVTAHAGLVA